MDTKYHYSDPPGKALILFADIVDSSVYSSLWGLRKYTEALTRFQGLFKELATAYFPDSVDDPTAQYCKVDSRGDEGIIFQLDNPKNQNPEDLVYRAVSFAIALKCEMELLEYIVDEDDEKSPKEMRVGVGIHYGEVALFSNITEQGRSVLGKIEGYNINYAKRVESCSRHGRHSQIFLSSAASTHIKGTPIILSEQSADMKGIGGAEPVFEVISGLFSELKLVDKEKERLINYCTDSINSCSYPNSAWATSILVSVLNDRLSDTPLAPETYERYLSSYKKLIWNDPYEKNPLILFCRALDCEKEKRYTRSLTYLKDILTAHPHFLHARDVMIRCCWEISQHSHETAELVYARDMAQELFDHYPDSLSATQKELFKNIIEKTLKH
jgi:class 3 adenylate cyclase